MKISELIKSVKEENLTKDQLENYYSELTSLSAEMELKMADIEKSEALFLNECGEETRSGADRKWRATKEGQEGITLKHNIRAIDKLRSSIKSRIYNNL
jgi:hypothetical protein